MKSIAKNRGIIFAFFGLISVLLILALSSKPQGAERQIRSNKVVPKKDVQIVYNTGAIAGCSISDLAERSSSVVYGTVTDISSPVIIKDYFGGASVHTDITVEPIETLRGPHKSSLTIRLSGGMANGTYWEYAEVPELFLGEKYLLFLHQPGMGNGLYENKDLYYLTGMYQGAFVAVSEKEKSQSDAFKVFNKEELIFANCHYNKYSLTPIVSVKDLSSTSIQSTNAVLSLPTLKTIFPSFNEEKPIDPDFYRKDIIDVYKSNLANDIITPEEYRYLMSSLDVYATAISEEELETLSHAEDLEKEELRKQLENF